MTSLADERSGLEDPQDYWSCSPGLYRALAHSITIFVGTDQQNNHLLTPEYPLQMCNYHVMSYARYCVTVF